MRIGIDLGGTKIEGIVLDDAGAIRFRERRATPRGDYDGTLDALLDLIAAAEAAIGQPATVGIGMPGAISPATGLVKNANSTWLIGRTLDRDLEARLGRPVRPGQRRQLLRALGGQRRRGGRRAGRVRCDRGHGLRRRRRRPRSGPHRAQRHCRRVGTQPSALACERGVAGSRVLLRQARAASRRICQAQAWPATTPSLPRWIRPASLARPSSHAPPAAIDTRSTRSIGMRIVWRVGSPL